MLAGSASTNPVLLFPTVGLMPARKVAGDDGLDRGLPPLAGTPWHGVLPDEGVPTARTAATQAV